MMQIHVVKSGETVMSIADFYGVERQALINSNALVAPYKIIKGQSLVVPTTGNEYFVQPGDNLYDLALTYGVTSSQIATLSGISPYASLNVGQKLHLPPRKKRNIESIGYLQPTSNPIKPALEESARTESKFLTYLAHFSFDAKRDGTLSEPPLGNIPQIAKDNRCIYMMVVSNLENGQFSTSLATDILQSPAVQDKLINTIISTANKYGFREVNIDFEDVASTDRVAYINFLNKVKSRLPQGFILSATLIPKTSSHQKGRFYEAHDYANIGKVVDFVVIMTYDWGWQGGPPMAVSPIDQVRKVINYAKTVIPVPKIVMGQNLYGFDWKVPFKQGTMAKALSAEAATNLAIQMTNEILFDNKAKAPHFRYTESNGQKHEVWFEDARSIQAKFNLIKEENIRGISYWKLGLPFIQNWELLEANFNVVKRA
ncbi:MULTISPECIES: glycosyl hydrolase family 18 protein [Bacillaceae]|uniref:glycosyl hydrolase family 18 protein n=1 Tax=Bacillaceae TaxID=186817 RepID=UPI000BF55069|nr:glycosyl hydrolase family 18 protein [Bacillus sp. AFS077874]PFM82920.1 glycosyl hydrolase [Bacillus sp. AFS077874]